MLSPTTTQALGEVLVSAIGVGIILWTSRSFGAYTERVERSNTITRQVVELAVQRIDARRDEAERVLQAVHRLRADMHREFYGSDEMPPQPDDEQKRSPSPTPSPITTSRSA